MQPVAFDAVDLKIIAILQADGRRSYSAIAEELDLPASSVRYRVQRLIDSGFLQIVGIADPLAIGFEHLAMIGIRTQPATARAVCAALKELPETSYVIMTAGHYDVMAEVICRDVRHFSELMAERLQTIPGIVSTESFFALEVHKLAYGWGVGNVATALPERRMAVSPTIEGQGAESLRGMPQAGPRWTARLQAILF
jgi:Lrp/AsnC family transcriptional regulator, regulator for asnA, asnC and gidA